MKMKLFVQPFTGEITLIPVSNFSYKKIIKDVVIRIPINQEMVLAKEMYIEGNLVIDGDLIFLE